jgi:hypothetical protein
VNTFGESPIEYGNFLGVDNNGNSYAAGLIDSETHFGDTSLSSLNENDLFVIKYDETGERIWLRASSSNGIVKYRNLFTDPAGNTVITGKFSNTVMFGDYTLVATNAEDGFVVKYDSSGICVGAKAIGNAGGSLVPAIDNEGSILVSGGFQNVSNFDGITLTSSGLSDVFVAKIDLKTAVPELRVDGSNELFIYANPNEGKCTIDVPDDFLYENNLVLRIFDTSGKLIRQSPLVMNQGKIQLSLEQEAKGVYTATLSNSQKSYHGRIVFE